MSEQFRIHDAVKVSRSSSSSSSSHGAELEGVVAFVGPVDFESGGDWIGVRLTGKSVGQGKHNGTVQSKAYFECPEKCGIFVRAAAVSKRTLTRLEELRLRRELGTTGAAAAAATAAASAGTSSAASSSTPTRSSTAKSAGKTPPRSSAAAAAAAPAAAADSSPSTAAKSKLEELRQRRAALKAKQSDVASNASAASSPAISRSASMANAETEELKSKLEEITKQFQQEKERANNLEEQCKEAKQEVETLKEQQQQQQQQLLQQQQTTIVETPTKALLSQTVEETQQQNLQLQSTHAALVEQLQDAQHQLQQLQTDLIREKENHQTALDQCTRARAEAAAYQNQLNTVLQQSDQRGHSDAAHYKERAKLQADCSALQRQVEALQREKMELEANMEDVVLDKEQLQEEKEALDDKYEELKLDAETAQMEVEELKLELEDARAAADRVHAVAKTLTGAALAQAGSSTSPSKAATTLQDEDEGAQQQQQQQDDHAAQAQALQVQNARLREALIRLREQSALEKMELSRQLRSVEKDAQAVAASTTQLQELQAANQQLREQISDLKDMVEQGAAFEGMVEDLSDRVLQMEEDNIGLQATIRELEEAAELTAEMEEVQAEELKALSLDLEGRDTIIRNLEEAIKMQRRREDDFRRTVGNYKTTVDTLKQEKQALLELQQGGEGEKSSLIASSQKALARAAQLVADAAEVRKREAQAAVDRVDRELYEHLSTRLEALLPHSVVAAELAAVKGELAASKVVGKASKTLAGIAASFRKNIRPALPQAVGEAGAATKTLGELKLSDEVQQQISTMMNQTEFARVIADISSELLRFLVAGQWPELLSPESSIELGSILGHTIPNLDGVLGHVLKSLMEEGSLTVDQSNVGELRLTIQNTMQSLKHDVEREDRPIVSPSWKPPGWNILKDASLAKFYCMGAAASLSLAVDDAQPEGSDVLGVLNVLYNRVEQCSSQASNVSLRLAMLDLKNEKLISTLSEEFAPLVSESETMLNAVRELLSPGGSGSAENCRNAAEATLRALAKLSSVLRAEHLAPNEGERPHAISPEADNAWHGVSSLARAVRAVDGDSEDVNFLLRAHAIEHQLGDAVEKEPLLVAAQTKVASLEKTLSSRSKEIAMQNARLYELEKLVAKSNSTPIGRAKGNFDFASTEEYNNLKEENRVLTEAMEVMQREIEMYENEIRALTTMKSPGKKAKGTPRRSMSDISSPNPRGGGAMEDAQNTSALEATLFRPALQQALQDAARWKASATATAIMSLPPLPPLQTVPSLGGEHGSASADAFSDDWIRLTAAISSARLQKASLTVVNLTDTSKTPRAQLRALKAKKAAADQRLESIVRQCKGRAK